MSDEAFDEAEIEEGRCLGRGTDGDKLFEKRDSRHFDRRRRQALRAKNVDIVVVHQQPAVRRYDRVKPAAGRRRCDLGGPVQLAAVVAAAAASREHDGFVVGL